MPSSQKRGWIDITVPVHNGMVRWPGSPKTRIRRIKDVIRGGSSTVSELVMGCHAGTHVDAPRHYFPSGCGVDHLPLEAAVGPARVIEIPSADAIQPAALRLSRIRKGERILFKTRNSLKVWKSKRFSENYVYLSTAAAQFLAALPVRMVGIDYLSVGGFRNNNRADAHRLLLKAGIWIVEGLNLAEVRPGRYHLCCLPLKVAGGDAAPARVILKKRDG